MSELSIISNSPVIEAPHEVCTAGGELPEIAEHVAQQLDAIWRDPLYSHAARDVAGLGGALLGPVVGVLDMVSEGGCWLQDFNLDPVAQVQSTLGAAAHSVSQAMASTWQLGAAAWQHPEAVGPALATVATLGADLAATAAPWQWGAVAFSPGKGSFSKALDALAAPVSTGLKLAADEARWGERLGQASNALANALPPEGMRLLPRAASGFNLLMPDWSPRFYALPESLSINPLALFEERMTGLEQAASQIFDEFESRQLRLGTNLSHRDNQNANTYLLPNHPDHVLKMLKPQGSGSGLVAPDAVGLSMQTYVNALSEALPGVLPVVHNGTGLLVQERLSVPDKFDLNHLLMQGWPTEFRQFTSSGLVSDFIDQKTFEISASASHEIVTAAQKATSVLQARFGFDVMDTGSRSLLYKVSGDQLIFLDMDLRLLPDTFSSGRVSPYKFDNMGFSFPRVGQSQVQLHWYDPITVGSVSPD